VMDRNDVIDILRNFSYTIQNSVAAMLRSSKEKVQSLVGSYSFNKPLDLLRQRSQRVDEVERRLHQIVGQRLAMHRQQAQSLKKRVQSLDPELVLKRGYTIVYRNQKIVPGAAQLSEKDQITVKFRDGQAESIVESVKKT